MAWLFSFIILLAVFHSSYTYKKQKVNDEEQYIKEIHPQPLYQEKKHSNNEKKYRYNEKEQRYNEEKQRSKENREHRHRSIEKVKPRYVTKANTADKSPKRARDSYELYDGQEKIWRFELDLPEVLRTLKKYTGVAISDVKPRTSQYYNGKLDSENRLRSSNDAGIFGQKIRVEMKPPNVASLLGYLNELINVDAARRQIDYSLGYVEETPGVVKSESVQYPKRYLEGRLKTLLKLKEKRDKKDK